MFDLIAKNLSVEQQAIAREFNDFNTSNPVRFEEADHQKAFALRDALGSQRCTFSNTEWIMMVTMAFKQANHIYFGMGLDNIKFPKLLPKGNPKRELAISLDTFIKSFKRNESKWLCNVNFEVGPDVIVGMLSAATTMAAVQNDKAFTPLMDWAEEVVMPQVRDRFVTLAGASKADANAVKISKDEIRGSVAKFVCFCTANPSGFLIA